MSSTVSSCWCTHTASHRHTQRHRLQCVPHVCLDTCCARGMVHTRLIHSHEFTQVRSGAGVMGQIGVRGPLTQTLTWNCTASGLLVAPES